MSSKRLRDCNLRQATERVRYIGGCLPEVLPLLFEDIGEPFPALSVAWLLAKQARLLNQPHAISRLGLTGAFPIPEPRPLAKRDPATHPKPCGVQVNYLCGSRGCASLAISALPIRSRRCALGFLAPAPVRPKQLIATTHASGACVLGKQLSA